VETPVIKDWKLSRIERLKWVIEKKLVMICSAAGAKQMEAVQGDAYCQSRCRLADQQEQVEFPSRLPKPMQADCPSEMEQADGD
jgi:hypothetical protein